MVGDPRMKQARPMSARRKDMSLAGIIGPAFAGGVLSCAGPIIQARSASAPPSSQRLNRFIFPSLRACARLLLAPRHNHQCDKCNQRSVFAARDGRAALFKHPDYWRCGRPDRRTGCGSGSRYRCGKTFPSQRATRGIAAPRRVRRRSAGKACVRRSLPAATGRRST